MGVERAKKLQDPQVAAEVITFHPAKIATSSRGFAIAVRWKMKRGKKNNSPPQRQQPLSQRSEHPNGWPIY
jgi:hypothetical protein